MSDEAPQETRRRDEGPDDDAGRPPEFETGRYLFCVVRTGGDATASAAESFSAEGIDGREARLVAAQDADLAAITQPCESLYDASDPETVRRWLLRHQAVVDAAGEAFGTPLPFRFDTVIVGDEDSVREWLESNAGPIEDALADLAGRWEYRIEVAVEDAAEGESLEAGDDELASLREEIDASEEGRAFLKEKQYDERLRALRRERREARAEDLVGRVEPLAERVEWGDAGSTSVSVVGDAGGGDSGGDAPGDGQTESASSDADGPTTAVSLAVLATPEAAEEIGEELEAVADEPGVEVRYTGPWPPYTFAPEIDASAGGASGGR